MPPRQLADPFSDAPAARDNPSQQSMRSNASVASSRTRSRRQQTLLSHSRTRRPVGLHGSPGRNEIHEDPHSDSDDGMMRAAPKPKPKPREESEFVNRREDGSYLLGTGPDDAKPSYLWDQTRQDYNCQSVPLVLEHDQEMLKQARHYFATGAGTEALPKRHHKSAWNPHDRELEPSEIEGLAATMMNQLRAQAIQKIESERWFYEDVDGPPGIR